MKVSELIEKLEASPQDAEIVIDYGSSMISGWVSKHRLVMYDTDGVKTVEIVEDLYKDQIKCFMRKISAGEGDLIPLEDFIQRVKICAFVDSDGFGRYSMAQEVSNKKVIPSELFAGIIDYSFTHVMWYNK